MRRVRSSKGFTLIEMLVVTAIMALISGLVLANNNRFGGVVLLQNLAYDIALSVRQAQISGISGQGVNSTFGKAYGMHFIPTQGRTTDSFALFADTVDSNGVYDNGELIESTNISGGFRIADLCATQPGVTSETCGLTWLDITFQRPEPDAFIRGSSYVGIYSKARIKLTSPRGDMKSIVVEDNGQISVQ